MWLSVIICHQQITRCVHDKHNDYSGVLKSSVCTDIQQKMSQICIHCCQEGFCVKHSRSQFLYRCQFLLLYSQTMNNHYIKLRSIIMGDLAVNCHKSKLNSNERDLMISGYKNPKTKATAKFTRRRDVMWPLAAWMRVFSLVNCWAPVIIMCSLLVWMCFILLLLYI